LKNLSENFDIIAKTFEGLETVLADEITLLGGRDIQILNRAVMFTGDRRLVYKANLWLRSALRVIIPIVKFDVYNQEDLYNRVKAMDWSKLLNPEMTIAVDSTINSSPFNHANFVALKVKDAIVDRMRDDFGKRPNVNTETPDLLINVHIFRNECTISLDSSGDSLHKRGYRQSQTDAPLNEVLAAGLILMTGWKGEIDFYDPMCGSGTFTTEAFAIAMNEPPGNSSSFGFMRWIDFDIDLWKEILQEVETLKKNVKVNFYTSDILGKAIAVTKLNMRRPEMRKKVFITQTDFFESTPRSPHGLIMLNPPYGERLVQSDIKETYKQIGNKLKFDYPGFDAWILIASTEAEKSVGLKPKFRKNVLNGAIPCKFNKYELYKGAKKDLYQ
jgi:putative N6-adenine-specific DNA methylase